MYCCNLVAVIVYVNSFCCMFFCTVLLSMKIWCTNCIMYEIKIMIMIITLTAPRGRLPPSR